MRKKRNIKVIVLRASILLPLIVISVLCFNRFRAYKVKPLSQKELSDIDFTKAENLMIVAHPDDEVIWGGGHLMERNFFVVCITNGKNKKRRREFESVIKKSGNQGIILSYPDKVNCRRDDWNKVKKQIENDLRYIIGYKDWGTIVTHNSMGEYGHIHHKITHKLVKDAWKHDKSKAKLMFFGRYFTKSKIGFNEKALERLSDEQLQYKRELTSMYKSQKDTVKMFEHMDPFENFITYSDGKADDNDKAA